MIRANLGEPSTESNVCVGTDCMPMETYKANLDRNVKIWWGLIGACIVASIAGGFMIVQYESKTRV
jgi:hypothetical protein